MSYPDLADRLRLEFHGPRAERLLLVGPALNDQCGGLGHLAPGPGEIRLRLRDDDAVLGGHPLKPLVVCNIVQLSRALGHHSASFTLDSYVHLLEGEDAPALDVAAALSRAEARPA